MADDASQRKAQNKALFNLVAPDYDSGPGCFAQSVGDLIALARRKPGQITFGSAGVGSSRVIE